MANPPNQQILNWMSEPTVLVNLFQIKDPHASDPWRYLYLPSSSFQLPGEGVNTDYDSATYVLKGPAFVAWSTTQDQLPGSDVYLNEFVSMVDDSPPSLGRRLMQTVGADGSKPDLPAFTAPTADPGILGAQPVYEHSAPTDSGVKYRYDFNPGGQDGWSKGQEVFWAVPPEYARSMLAQAAQEAESQFPGGGDLTSPESVRQLVELAGPVLKAGGAVDDRNLENLVSVFKGKGLPVKAFTNGLGVEGSFLFSGMGKVA